MKTLISSRNRGRRGMTYATIIVSMIVIGTVLAAFLKMVEVQNQLTVRSQTWNRAVPVVEAGIEEAVAHLNKNGSPDAGGEVNLANLSLDGWYGPTTGPWYKIAYLGDDIYYSIISAWNGNPSNCPTIMCYAFVRNTPTFAMRHLQGPMLAQGTVYSYSRRVVECGTTNNPTFTKALLAKKGIDMNGNNVGTDSYDSTIPAYNTAGRWDVNKRRANGDVASNDTVTNSVNVGNANVRGRVATGPLGTVYVGPQGAVGDLAWHAGNNKGIKPGWSTDDMNAEFPDVRLPAGSDGWLPLPSVVAGTVQLTTGDYRVPSGTVSGKIIVASNANVRLRIDGTMSLSGQDELTIQPGGNIKIYLNGSSATLTGNGIVNTAGRPINCQIYGTSNLRTLAVGGNGEITAVLYAPYADVTLHGGGNGDQDYSGALVANSFKFTGHYQIHYDESLGRSPIWRGFSITSWNER